MGQSQFSDINSQYLEIVRRNNLLPFYDENPDMVGPSDKLTANHMVTITQNKYDKQLNAIDDALVIYSNFGMYSIEQNAMNEEMNDLLNKSYEKLKTNNLDFNNIIDTFFKQLYRKYSRLDKQFEKIKEIMNEFHFKPVDKPFYSFTQFKIDPIDRAIGKGPLDTQRYAKFPFMLDKLEGIIFSELAPNPQGIDDCCMVRIEFAPGARCIVHETVVYTLGPLLYKGEKIINGIKVITYTKL